MFSRIVNCGKFEVCYVLLVYGCIYNNTALSGSGAPSERIRPSSYYGKVMLYWFTNTFRSNVFRICKFCSIYHRLVQWFLPLNQIKTICTKFNFEKWIIYTLLKHRVFLQVFVHTNAVASALSEFLYLGPQSRLSVRPKFILNKASDGVFFESSLWDESVQLTDIFFALYLLEFLSCVLILLPVGYTDHFNASNVVWFSRYLKK